MNNSRISLKIADTIILLTSRFPIASTTETLAPPLKKEIAAYGDLNWRFRNFIYKGKAKPDIKIKVKVVKKLPQAYLAEHIFITKHFQDGKENWRLVRRNSKFIYLSPLKHKEQYAVFNKDFTKAVIYLLPKTKNDENGKKNLYFNWEYPDIIYDFLQIMMIHYFTLRDGLFTHGVGIQDIDKKGLLFVGKSGCGKTTTAKLWYKHTKARVLNDDRVIVRKIKNTFFIYGTPWHGDFSDYLSSHIERARLKRIFFIYHGKKNAARAVAGKESFTYLYPTIFPPFWDKAWLSRTTSLCLELIRRVPSCRMGFTKDKKVIAFTRQIAKAT